MRRSEALESKRSGACLVHFVPSSVFPSALSTRISARILSPRGAAVTDIKTGLKQMPHARDILRLCLARRLRSKSHIT